MILALEFSTQRRSAALFEASQTGTGLPRLLAVGEEEAKRGVSAFVLIERLLAEGSVTPPQISMILVGLGPGSYTGIRSALSIALGWRLARAIPAVGLGTMDLLAAQAQALGCGGRLHVVIDAQREEIYAATGQMTPGGRAVLGPIRLLKPSDLVVEDGDWIVGPEATRWFAQGRDVHPDARMMARVVWEWPDLALNGDLEPIYPRPTTFVKAPPARILPSEPPVQS